MKNDSIIKNVVKELSKNKQFEAIGISGSIAGNETDEFSDIDLIIYYSGNLPQYSFRKKFYNRLKAKQLYPDINFDFVVCDGIRIGTKRTEIVYQNIERSYEYIENLCKDFMSDEYFPGGIQQTIAVYDPNRIIKLFKSKTACYPAIRSRKRSRKMLKGLVHSLKTMEWLDQAVERNDFIQFMRKENEYIQQVIEFLYAFNAEWYCDDKRLMENMIKKKLEPLKVVKKIEQYVCRRNQISLRMRKNSIYDIVNLCEIAIEKK